MDYETTIEKLVTEQEAAVRKGETLISLAEGEDRDFTEDEQGLYNDIEKDIEAKGTRIARLQKLEQELAKRAVPVTSAKESGSHITVKAKERPKGTIFAYMAHVQYMTKGDARGAADYCRRNEWYDLEKWFSLPPEVQDDVRRNPSDYVQRTAVGGGATGTDTWAEELVSINQASEQFIELLRSASIAARIAARTMTFGRNGSIQIPKITTGVSGAWVAESGAIPVEAQAYDQVTMTPKKIATIVWATNELLRRSDPSIMELIRDDMIQGTATTVDTRFALDTQVTSAPDGIFYGAGSDTATAGGDLDAIDTDLKLCLNAMRTANLPESAWTFLCRSDKATTLQFIRDGLGQHAYKDEVSAGRLAGQGLIVSNAAVDDSIGLIANGQVIMATELVPTISMSTDATFHSDDAPDADMGAGGTPSTPIRSMWQLDATALRITWAMDWTLRHATAAHLIKSVSW